MNNISLKSYAKINLGLDVTGKLPNGYHSLKMIMQTISLYDNLYFEKRKNPGIVIKTNLPFLPVNEKNIVYKAAKLFMETYHTGGGIYCNISKKIPVAAGMAGGSGNAAAALLALNELYGTKLTPDTLSALGLKLGADVPYCLLGNTALAEGIGEILTPLPSPPDAKVLIVKPRASISTKEVYSRLEINENTIHPDIDACITAIKNKSLNDLCANLGNVLEEVTIPMCPAIAEIKEKMLTLGACGSLMSGSGPTVFGLFSDEKTAQEAYHYFSDKTEKAYTSFLCDFH